MTVRGPGSWSAFDRGYWLGFLIGTAGAALGIFGGMMIGRATNRIQFSVVPHAAPPALSAGAIERMTNGRAP